MRTSLATLTLTTLITIFMAAIAQATPTQVNVRIEGPSETVFEGPILTEGHNIKASSDSQERSCDGINTLDPQNTTPGPTPTAASVDAMSIIGETFDGQWYDGYEDYFITRWGPDEQSGGAYWGILVNNVFTNVGGCQYELRANNEVLWVYNAFEGEPFLSLLPVEDNYTSGPRPLTATAHLGEPFEVEVLDYADDTEDDPPSDPERKGASPFEGADVSPVKTSTKGFEKVETSNPATVVTDAQGKASITFEEPGWHRIKATVITEGEEDPARSNRLDVCVPATGESSCGELPVEDQVRVPPPPLDEHHGESLGTGTGQQSGTNTSGGPSSTTTGQGAAGPLARVAFASLSPARLLLKLTVPGKATVKIAHNVGKRHHRRWQTIKIITAQVAKAGLVEIKLPRLPAGSYRVSVSLAGANSVVKTLTVPRKRR